MEAYENELVMKCFIVALLSHTAQGRGAHWWLTSTMISQGYATYLTRRDVFKY